MMIVVMMMMMMMMMMMLSKVLEMKAVAIKMLMGNWSSPGKCYVLLLGLSGGSKTREDIPNLGTLGRGGNKT